MLGWTADELLGRDWIDTCVPPRIRDGLQGTRRNLLQGDLSVVEHPVLTRSGEERLIEWRNTLLRDEGGRITGSFSSGTDITERKHAEDEVRRHAQLSAQAELEFRALFAANPLPMWIYDLTTLKFLEVNDAAVRQYGYDRDEFLAMTIGEIRPPEDLEGLVERIDRPRESWQKSGSWRHRLKSGRIVDVDITSHTITFAAQPAVLVVAQDITERTRSAEALRTAEERMRFALQSADVGIWDMDYTTGVLRWSEILEAQYGLEPGTFGGTFEAFVERIHPDDRELRARDGRERHEVGRRFLGTAPIDLA